MPKCSNLVIHLGFNAHFIFLNSKVTKFLKIFFILKTNQMFVVCYDFVGVKHDLHHLKSDMILKCLLMCLSN